MTNNRNPNPSGAAQAIDEVLAAETAAREAMEACHQQAEELLEVAREDARRITRTANQRASRLSTRCDALVEERIAELRAAAVRNAMRSELDEADHQRLKRAIEHLASRLTRPDEDDG
jgi:vacuolar-type H+-ATPase subunit H